MTLEGTVCYHFMYLVLECKQTVTSIQIGLTRGRKEGRRLEMAVSKVDICSPAEKVIYWVL